MNETTSPETNSSIPLPQGGEAPPAITSEQPPDDKNRIINRLKNISNVVSEAYREQSKSGEQSPFNQRAGQLIQLGNNYISYLEAHANEFNDNKIFQAVGMLAKTSLLMSIEQYAATIRGIAEYVSQHPELNDLNPPGKKDGPWANIKEALYYTVNNDTREQYRERILAKAQLLIVAGDFSVRDVDHLERFLVDPQGRLPSQFIPEYIEQHAADLRSWLPLGQDDFLQFVIDRLSNYQGEMSENPPLRQLDEELASIKPKDIQEKSLVKTRYQDREKKLALVRDLRFGRADINKIKAEVSVRVNDISRQPDVRKTLGPILKNNLQTFMEALGQSVGQEPQVRKAKLLELISKFNLSDENIQAISAYLGENL